MKRQTDGRSLNGQKVSTHDCIMCGWTVSSHQNTIIMQIWPLFCTSGIFSAQPKKWQQSHSLMLRNGPQILLRFHDFFTLEGMFVVPRPETSWLFSTSQKPFHCLPNYLQGAGKKSIFALMSVLDNKKISRSF